MNPNVKITAVLTALPGKEGELRALLAGMVTASRAEPGNLRYDIWIDQTSPQRFVLDELYADGEAVAAHRASSHFQFYLAVIGELADRSALTLDPLDVA
ncbi:putative quinol monooxygenase [Novosphingobium sp. BL-8A]|uniref:putative quinol monooxygenase n=1 Tax=Novosphingobium sp. BL-8A TaxID=3127639 RepID=UPI0037562F7B